MDAEEIKTLAGKVRSGANGEKVEALRRLSKLLTDRCQMGPFCRHLHSLVGEVGLAGGKRVGLYAGGPRGFPFVFVSPGKQGTFDIVPVTAETLLEEPDSAGALAGCIEYLAFGEWARGVGTQPPALA